MPEKINEKRHSRITNFDIELARMIKERRQMLGLSQEELADASDVTFQQIQKYENATNRVSASRLISISKALNVTPGYFYKGYDNSRNQFEKDIIDLVKAYNSISDKNLQKQMLQMMKNISRQY